MRLEKIILDGFKSFADRTELNFDSPLTAIVGPNGCGKSNVVDAVKWVLGEQSTKNLRSGQMSDVIFSGSSSRKSKSSAEVTLVISNNNGELAVGTEQVEISRRIYMSGESEYRINNKPCRLKDIREMFMDTGVGARAYSIIEQGQIEQLLNASKKDRRYIFEEAAGISKYKAHKKEALRKLERTEQNLLRLADVLSEVTKNLRSIKLQAGKARNYLNYTERLKALQLNYSLAEYADIEAETEAKKAESQNLQEQCAQISADVSRADISLSEVGEKIVEAEKKLNETGNRLVVVESKIEQSQQRIDFLRSRISELEERKDSSGKKLQDLKEERKYLEQELSRFMEEKMRCRQSLEEKQRQVEQVQEEIKGLDSECSSISSKLEDEKSGVIDIVRRTAQLHNELQSISMHRNTLSSQKDRLADRAEDARGELGELLTRKANHQARYNDIEKVLEELQTNLGDRREEIEQIEARIGQDSKVLSDKKEQQSALNSELGILVDMENKREGVNSAVKSILESQAEGGSSVEVRPTLQSAWSYVEGMLADIISADAEYAPAVEAALEGRADALVVSNPDALLSDKGLIEQLEGRVHFISMDTRRSGIKPFVDQMDLSRFPGVKGRIAEFIETDWKYAPLVWRLLGKSILVESLDSVSGLREELASAGPASELPFESVRFVTQKGEVIGDDGSIKLGPMGKQTGLISRRSRIKQIEEFRRAGAAEIEGLEKQIEEQSRKKAHLSQLCQELRTSIYEANTEKTRVSSELSGLGQDIKRLQKEQPIISSEMDMLEEQVQQSVHKEYESRQQLEELEAVNTERNAQIKKLEAEYEEQKQKVQSRRSGMTELRVSLGQLNEQKRSLEQTAGNLEGRLEQNRAATESAHEEIENLVAPELRKAQSGILECEGTVSELFVEKERNQHSRSMLHQEIEGYYEKRKHAEGELNQKRSEQDEIEERINEVKIGLSRLEVKRQDLVERVRDELEVELSEAYSQVTERDRVEDWEALKGEISELREKISRLGNVNVDAISEQERLEARHEFLSSQVEDLNRSKSGLVQLINRLNRQSRERFTETFEKIRIHFQEIFRKLFGGGKADIYLEDTEEEGQGNGSGGSGDILDAPIEIKAKPPGKETRGISLLSGGEKALSAIALLFAVFKAKPSPFCFLDEIDAALDEANNERFNLMVQEFLKDSQFIVITHSKRTMSIADILYGITMQTRGVSKKISVSFEEYEDTREAGRNGSEETRAAGKQEEPAVA